MVLVRGGGAGGSDSHGSRRHGSRSHGSWSHGSWRWCKLDHTGCQSTDVKQSRCDELLTFCSADGCFERMNLLVSILFCEWSAMSEPSITRSENVYLVPGLLDYDFLGTLTWHDSPTKQSCLFEAIALLLRIIVRDGSFSFRRHGWVDSGKPWNVEDGVVEDGDRSRLDRSVRKRDSRR
jgi:hypothetical protein